MENCAEMEVSVVKVCLPIEFKLYDDVEVKFYFEFN